MDKIKSYKIIFSDIDGTLLTSALTISPRTREAIAALKERQARFVIVSGRTPRAIYPVLDENGLRCPLVAANGALLLNEERQILSQTGISQAEAQGLADFLAQNRLPASWCFYSGEDWLVADTADPRVQAEERTVRALARQGVPADFGAGRPVDKVLLLCDPDTVDAVHARVAAAYPQWNVLTNHGLSLIDVIPRGINKGEGLRRLCALWGIDPRDTLALGDNYNDVEMLSAVGLAVVMGNAPAELRAGAAAVTADNDHDGVALAIEKYVLGL